MSLFLRFHLTQERCAFQYLEIKAHRIYFRLNLNPFYFYFLNWRTDLGIIPFYYYTLNFRDIRIHLISNSVVIAHHTLQPV